MLAAFQHYGFSHVSVLILITLTTVLIVRSCKKDASSYPSRLSIALLTFFCFAIYPIHQIFHSITGGAEDMESLFPFHLCDIAAFICGFALITRKPLMCELAYFWGLAGTMQGLLTPDLNHDFPSPVKDEFWLPDA